jgi:hypothetical protein
VGPGLLWAPVCCELRSAVSSGLRVKAPASPLQGNLPLPVGRLPGPYPDPERSWEGEGSGIRPFLGFVTA